MADGQLDGLPPAVGDGQTFRIVNLLREVTALSRRLERHLADEFDLNHTDLAAMEHLSRSGSTTPRELADELGVTSAATTFVVDRLAAMGHVHRSPHPDDRRKTLVTADPGSLQSIAERMMPLGMGMRAFMDEFTPAELDAIERFLTRTSAAIRDQLPD